MPYIGEIRRAKEIGRHGGGGGAWQSRRASPSTMGEEEEGEGQGCTNERSNHVLWAAPRPHIYRGRGGLRPL